MTIDENAAETWRHATSSDAAPVRICVIGSGWMFTSGISYYTCRLANALAERQQVSVVLMRRLIPRRLYPGRARVGTRVNNLAYAPQVPVYNGVDWNSPWSLLRAAQFLRRQRPEAVILQWWTGAVLPTYLILVVVAKRIGARIVVEFHETQDTGESRLPLARLVFRALGKAIVRRCDGAVVHSDFDRQEVLRLLPLEGKPMVIAPHAPYDHHVATQPKVRHNGNSALRLLFFGTIRPYKGLEHLVQALDLLDHTAARSLHLTIVGETWEGWTLPLELVQRSRHRDRITVVNRYVHDDEVAQYFADADAVALPYTRSSASGPLHIAMAAGLPVVLTDVGGLRAAAEGYEGVLWVPPANPQALAKALMRLPELVGHRYQDPRSWDDTVKAFGSLWEAVSLQS